MENVYWTLAAISTAIPLLWLVFKLYAKSTKSKKDDKIVEKYDDTLS